MIFDLLNIVSLSAFFSRSHYNNYYCKGLSESFFVSQCNLTNKLTGLVWVMENLYSHGTL